MPLRLEWDQEPETPQVVELALIDRYASAQQLMLVEEWDAAIYIFGYVAEMVLKTAYFRVRGNNPSDTVALMLSPAKTRGQQIIPDIAHENYHSLDFWSALLRAERTQQQRPLLPAVEAQLISFTQTLYQNWMVEMRYHPNRASEANAQLVADAAEWLFSIRVELGA